MDKSTERPEGEGLETAPHSTESIPVGTSRRTFLAAVGTVLAGGLASACKGPPEPGSSFRQKRRPEYHEVKECSVTPEAREAMQVLVDSVVSANRSSKKLQRFEEGPGFEFQNSSGTKTRIIINDIGNRLVGTCIILDEEGNPNYYYEFSVNFRPGLLSFIDTLDGTTKLNETIFTDDRAYISGKFGRGLITIDTQNDDSTFDISTTPEETQIALDFFRGLNERFPKVKEESAPSPF